MKPFVITAAIVLLTVASAAEAYAILSQRQTIQAQANIILLDHKIIDRKDAGIDAAILTLQKARSAIN